MKITKRELHRLLGEAKKKPKADDATQKTRPDGYADLPTFMTHGRQSPTKYSGYGAQLGTGVIDDPAVADPEGDSIDADALRVVRQLQARGAGQKEDRKKKLKEATVNVTRRDIRRLVNEALSEMSMMGGPRGMRRPRQGMCLYVLIGRSSYYFVAPCGMSEKAASEMGTDITPEIDPEGMGMADALMLYEWLQSHDEITHVVDEESTGLPEVTKAEYMEQLLAVAESEGLIAPQDVVNEGDEPLDETEDQHYNDDLQSRLGRFTSPENVKGTPQHKEKHAPPAGGGRGGSGYVSRRSEWGDADLYGGPPRVDEGRDADVDCLYILKRGGQYVYIVARPYIESAEELAETGNDITDMIMAQGPAARNSNVYEFLSSNPQVAVVRVRGAFEMASDYMMELEDSMDFSTGPVYEGAFPEELEGIYGAVPPDFGKRGSRDDSFMDYDPEEIPDMDDQYDPEYYEGLDDEEDDEDFMDYETGDDDVPYGAADVALRMGRGYRTDEGSLNESIDMMSAGIGAIVGIAALYAAGPLSRVATNILNTLSDAQRSAAMEKAREKAGTELAEAIENLSRDTKLVALFRELEAAQEDGTSREAREKSKEITAYISEKRKDMSFGHGDAQLVRRGVAKRLKKGDDDKKGDSKDDEKLDEARWAKLAGILKG